jgi:hypothetical protein
VVLHRLRAWEAVGWRIIWDAIPAICAEQLKERERRLLYQSLYERLIDCLAISHVATHLAFS